MSLSTADGICSMPDCNEPPRSRQRYCAECHKKYMRAWRARRKRDDEKLKASVLKLRQRVMAQSAELKELKTELG